jgi:xylose isomerase
LNETVEMMLVLLRSGGFQGGGVNFDAKTRRNSTDLVDIFHGHIGGMDVFARALIIADKILSKSKMESMRKARYASFDSGNGALFEKGQLDLEKLAELGNKNGEPAQISGQQEVYENIINWNI